jgi:hypothetical protein
MMSRACSGALGNIARGFGALFVIAVAGMPVFATPARAQPSTEFTQTAMTFYTLCREARDAGDARNAVETCAASESDVVALRDQTPGATTEEQDYVAFVLAVIQQGIAAEAMDLEEGVRTAEVCAAAERAWTSFREITPGSTTFSIVAPTAGGAADDVRHCRREHGTPVGARPLP